ncbi:TadE/TadG family type IV pilus assembly protein [Microvirga alba]|uniref:Pilus assembly protein n=1 Tax=Microvirga alba TaxID=2791025 RepID=A0A931BWS9_9HYPH|nr:TadE/TadG family type IV pilus assembly protein [Microvirga alba]MBF9234257.1 pilus assembly protein [Microvirga alba]
MRSLALVLARAAYEAVRSRMAGFAGDRSGSVAVFTALALPVLIGVTGLGVEISYWYLTERSMQNAADSAAIAAATNGTMNYGAEAKAAAAKYGFVDGENDVSVVASNNATCPSGAANCYSATVTGYVPLFLSQVVGYKGTAIDSSGTPQTKLSATAVARLNPMPREYCVLALGDSGIAIGADGAPRASMSGCNIMSNAGARCNGHNLGADYGDAADENDGCGAVQRSNVARLADPYVGLKPNIPSTDPCGGKYPQKGTFDYPAANKWKDTIVLTGGVTHVCGDLTVTFDVTIRTPPEGAVIVIWNGQLYTGRWPQARTFATESGSAVTVVFAGANGSYTHTPTGDGTLDITAPSTGPWKGMAIYQDPNLTSGVDIPAAGQAPTWNITGMVYLPHADVTLSGAVNKSSTGQSCFGLVIENLAVTGTGSILAHGACDEAGLDLPTGSASTGRGALVR